MRLIVSSLVAVLVAAVVAPGARADHTQPQPATRPVWNVAPAESLYVPTRAGVVYVRLVRPSVPPGYRVPVIIKMTPYALLTGEDDDLVRNGYARAVVHVPGTGNSGGCFDLGGLREQQAAWDVIDHLASRPWSNGRVGMTGISYDGTTANMAATSPALPEGPHPALEAIVPEVAIGDWYGYSYHDGVRYFVSDPAQRQGLVIDEQGFDTPLAFDAGYGLAPPADRRHPDPVTVSAERLCPGMADKLDHTVHGYTPQPDKDAFWAARDYTAAADRVTAAVLVRGGWRDWNVKRSESTRFFDAVPDTVPSKLLVMDGGAHSSADPRTRFDALRTAFFDRYLYGYETNVVDQHAFLSITNDGVVRTDDAWPPSTATIEHELPTGVLVDTGRTTETDALHGAPEAIWWESEPVAAATRIAGIPTLELALRTLGTSTHLTPVLFDLGPHVTTHEAPCTYAGADELDPTGPDVGDPGVKDACVISRGFLDTRYRDDLSAASPVTPGEAYTATVRFVDTDHVLAAGHRLGVALMTSNAWWAVPSAERAVTVVDAATLRLPTG